MSVRDFAAHLGVNDAAVSNWERRADKANLRYETQQLLDVDLSSAPAATHERFALLLSDESGVNRDAETDALAPADLGAPNALANFGRKSAERTRSLLAAARGADGHQVEGPPDLDALRAVRSFAESPARTFVLQGPPGSGKTHFTQHAAEDLTDAVDVQLHSVDTWNLTELDVAAEILRFASLPRGADPLLTLERAGELLTRQCLIVIDGINDPGKLDSIGRQLDAIVRQVTSGALRFLLVIRSPPDADLTAFPMLASSMYDSPDGHVGSSHVTGPWDMATARDTWNRSRGANHEPSFSDLPPSLQSLARLPLYMHLIKAAGSAGTPGDLNPYRLIDHCITSIFAAGKQDSARMVRELAELAQAESPQIVSPHLDACRAGAVSATRWVTERLPTTSPLVRLTESGKPVFISRHHPRVLPGQAHRRAHGRTRAIGHHGVRAQRPGITGDKQRHGSGDLRVRCVRRRRPIARAGRDHRLGSDC